MAGAEPAKKTGGGFQRFVLWVLIFGLLAVVWWLASERNERHFRVAAESSVLFVERGRFFPMGTARIDATDPTFGKAYGPLQLPPGAKVSEAEYDDQSALDRALFDLIQPLTKTLAQKGDVAGAQALLDRATLLPGLTAQQRTQLAALEGDLAWTTAHNDLRQAARLLLSARRKLEQVRDAAGEHALEAASVSRQLVPVVDELAAVEEGKTPRAAATDGGTAEARVPPPPATAPAPGPNGAAPNAAAPGAKAPVAPPPGRPAINAAPDAGAARPPARP